MRRLFVPLLVLLLAAPAARGQSLAPVDPADAGFSPERLARLEAVFDDYVEAGRLPGGVVLVARQGRTVHLDAFGHRDREAGALMPEDALFRIASQTKALVSVAVMILQERGALRISDPVGRHLPAFRETTVAVPDDAGGYAVVETERAVTIRDLLTHTAGLGYGYGPARDRWEAAGITGWYFADRDEPVRATVDRLAALPFDAQPGEAFVYGYATDVLGALVEAVDGRPLDAFLRDEILRPLGMTDTHFYVPPGKRDRLATVYGIDDDGALVRAPDGGGMTGQGAYADGPRASFSGGAGLVSTAHDYARFLQMMLDGGVLDGRRILSPKTVELMTANHIGGLAPFGQTGRGFGLGFYVVEDVGAHGVPGSVGEFGWGGAYHSAYWVDPAEGLVVVYFTQVIPASGLDDHATLRNLIYAALVD